MFDKKRMAKVAWKKNRAHVLPNELENKRTNSKQDDGVLDGLDLEVEPDEWEDETLEILHQVVECAQTLGILGVVDVDQRSDLGRSEGNVFVAAHDLQLLGGGEGGNELI